MVVAEEREAVVDGEGSDWVLGVDEDIQLSHEQMGLQTP